MYVRDSDSRGLCTYRTLNFERLISAGSFYFLVWLDLLAEPPGKLAWIDSPMTHSDQLILNDIDVNLETAPEPRPALAVGPQL